MSWDVTTGRMVKQEKVDSNRKVHRLDDHPDQRQGTQVLLFVLFVLDHLQLCH